MEVFFFVLKQFARLDTFLRWTGMFGLGQFDTPMRGGWWRRIGCHLRLHSQKINWHLWLAGTNFECCLGGDEVLHTAVESYTPQSNCPIMEFWKDQYCRHEIFRADVKTKKKWIVAVRCLYMIQSRQLTKAIHTRVTTAPLTHTHPPSLNLFAVFWFTKRWLVCSCARAVCT